MRHTLFLLFVISALSCNNDKERKTTIIEEQKRLKHDASETMRARDKFHSDHIGQIENPDSSVMFVRRIDSLNYIYDSLEMELKKY